MKQVVCINPKNYNLTQGREYEVANNPVNGFYNVINNNGSRRRYKEDLFRDVLPAEDSVETILSTLRLEQYGHNGTSIRLIIDGNNIGANFAGIQGRLTISCGINSISGINVIINNIVNNIINRGNIRALILSRVLEHMTVRNYGITLISTNITNNHNIQLLEDSLSLIPNRQVDIITNNNPNSGNDILLAVISNISTNDQEEEEDDVEDITTIEQVN